MIAVKNFWNHYDFFFKYKENAIVTYTIVIYFSNTKEKRKQLSKKKQKNNNNICSRKEFELTVHWGLRCLQRGKLDLQEWSLPDKAR